MILALHCNLKTWRNNVKKMVTLSKIPKFWVNPSIFCGNCEFPKSINTRKLGEITVFYAMLVPIPYQFLMKA